MDISAASHLNSLFSIKEYEAGGYYHLTTHAVPGEDCFLDNRDYGLFMRLLNARLSPIPVRDEHRRLVRSFHGEIDLIAFCLMKNHPHLLLRQESEYAIAAFANSLLTSYAMRFNKRHNRSGPLFRRPYKARLIDDHERLRHVAEYIHLNPFRKGMDPFAYRWSSHRYFAGLARADWCNSDEGVGYFGGRGGYLRRMHDATTRPWKEPFD